MNSETIIDRTLFIVDRCMRSAFPNDYYKRCMYGAFAIERLLRGAGIEASISGGNFVGYVISKSGIEASLQGFGFGSQGPSHFWVRVGKSIVDLGPSYLPVASRFSAHPMPYIAWKDIESLPKYLRYETSIDYPPGAILNSTAEINSRMDSFLSRCHDRYSKQRGQPKLRNWVLRNSTSLEDASKIGKSWAIGAKAFEENASSQELPF